MIRTMIRNIVRVNRDRRTWRFGYETTIGYDPDAELHKTAHWLMLGPVAICLAFR